MAGTGGGLPSRLVWNGDRLLRRAATRLAMPPGSGTWLRLALSTPVEELPLPALFTPRGPSLPLIELLAVLEQAAQDDRVDGLLLELGGGVGGFATALALRRGLAALDAAGKPVVAWGERLGPEELMVASAARRFYLPPAGHLALVGLRIEGLFLKGLLQQLGVVPEVVRIGSFKTAGEMLTREGMSPAQREQLEAVLDARFGALVDALAEGRGLSPERVRELVDEGPWTSRDAAEVGLCDGCLHKDELEAELEKLAPPRGDRLRLLDVASYHALRLARQARRPLRADLPCFAYVVARGAIHSGVGLRGIAADRYRALLARLARDPRVWGVVLRVDSPGGDGLASDALWRSVSRLRREKPVVVSMAEVAASGGYYLASAADRILAEAVSVTGSIGVVGGKLDLSALYQRLGVGREAVERGARAGLASETRGFTPDERAALRGEMEQLYELFLQRVGSGRGLEREAVHAVAQGRVWSGQRAREHGLVDELGGPQQALAALRALAGLQPGEPERLEILPRLPRFGSLPDLLLGRARAVA